VPVAVTAEMGVETPARLSAPRAATPRLMPASPSASPVQRAITVEMWAIPVEVEAVTVTPAGRFAPRAATAGLMPASPSAPPVLIATAAMNVDRASMMVQRCSTRQLRVKR